MNAPLRLASDAAGFLVGRPIGDDEAQRILGGIKRDTAAILLAMRRLQAAQRDERRFRAAQAQASGARSRGGSGLPPAVPAGRAGALRVDRDPVTGRFVARPSSAGAGQAESAAAQRQARDFGDVAKAATDVARTAEATRRDARANQQRHTDGRFKAGEDSDGGGASGGGTGGQLGASAGALASSAGAALDGTAQVDPLLGAASELKGLASGARAVWEPIGRAGSGLFGSREESEGWLRKLWREFRAMRKDSAKGTKDTIRAVKGVRTGGGEGGGLFDSLLSAIPALLRSKAVIGGGVGALATWITSAIGDTVKGALDEAWAQLKKVPLAGGIARGAEAIVRWFTADPATLKSERAGMEGVLINAANAARVDPNLVTAIARYETGGTLDPDARPRRGDGSLISSAHGLGQFTDATWLDAIQRFGHKAGVGRGAATTMEEAQALRGDPALQARMLAEWTAKNAGQARRLMGRNDPAAVYAMHVLGEGDGPKFLRALRANPNAAISSVLPADVIANNPSLFGGATLGDAFGKLGKAVSGASRDAGAPRLPATTMRRPPPPALPATRPVPSVRTPSPAQVPAATATDIGEAMRVGGDAPAPPLRVVVQQPLGQDVRDRGVAHVVSGGIGQGPRR